MTEEGRVECDVCTRVAEVEVDDKRYCIECGRDALVECYDEVEENHALAALHTAKAEDAQAKRDALERALEDADAL